MCLEVLFYWQTLLLTEFWLYLLHLPWVEIYWDLLSDCSLLALASLRQNRRVSVFFIFLLEYFMAAILFSSSFSPYLYGFKLLQSLFSGYLNDNLLHQLRHAMSLSLVPFVIYSDASSYIFPFRCHSFQTQDFCYSDLQFNSVFAFRKIHRAHADSFSLLWMPTIESSYAEDLRANVQQTWKVVFTRKYTFCYVAIKPAGFYT